MISAFLRVTTMLFPSTSNRHTSASLLFNVTQTSFYFYTVLCNDSLTEMFGHNF